MSTHVSPVAPAVRHCPHKMKQVQAMCVQIKKEKQKPRHILALVQISALFNAVYLQSWTNANLTTNKLRSFI